MGHLHELIAVDRDLEATMNKILKETVVTFTKKPDHFRGFSKRLNMFAEDRKHEESAFSEDKEIVTTVAAKLNHTQEYAVRYTDAALQRESTNQVAKGSIVVDGAVIAADMPVTFLLGLEKTLAKWREVFATVPTLDPSVVWDEDISVGAGVFRASHDDLRLKTEKTINYKTIAEATKEHKAQVVSESTDKSVGEYSQVNWSGMITPAAKARMLDNLDRLLAATKKARMRANEEEVVSGNIGESLFSFIRTGSALS
ncbi:hypothetical protein KAR91_27630 [Candidatus Pacearchaeota archaeon]|nr:hypothetical protein [Candidatus Pacearchaeota archaeon]